jgi:uncharacterized membrane protein
MPFSLKTNMLLRSIYFSRTEIERLLILSSLFSLVLLGIRIIATGKPVFLFLPWNLFLAFVPYCIVTGLMANLQWIENKFLFCFTFLVWLVFIPNSFYILTDLFHLELTADSPRWFDLTMIFSFAWNGMLLGILSVKKMETIIGLFLKKRNIIFFLYPVMWLIAFGIYVGRYLRFNSWDIITNPFSLFGEIAEMFINPSQYTYAWGMIFCFSIFITLLYLTIKKISFSFSEKHQSQ